jgi:peptidoglycan/xylan/chitin deacetylase (PgdA/CDA1 family)
LAYHKIDGGFELGVNSISPQVFDRQMRFLAEHGYTTITVDRFIQAIEAFSRQKKTAEEHSFSSSQLPRGSSSRLKQEEDKRTPHPLSHEESLCEQEEGLSLPPRSIVITFDDGYGDFYTSAHPILTKYGMTATVFVLAGYIGKLNTWDVQLRLKQSQHLTSKQIQTLFGKGFGIASHGMHHRFLTRCNDANTKLELSESKAILENLLHHPIHSFAYPYGCVNAKVAERVKSAGYRIAFSLTPNKVIASESIYCYPRIAVYRCDTLSTFQAKLGLLGQYRFKLECVKNTIINRFAYLNRLRH